MHGIRPTPDPVRLVSCDRIDPRALLSLIHRNPPRLAQYFPGTLRAGETLADTHAYLARHRTRARDGCGFLFAVPTPDGRGLAGLVFVSEIDPDAGTAEAAGMIDAGWEGSGLMQAAMKSAFRWCRDELGLRRIRFLIAAENHRSIALATALGFSREPRDGRSFRKGTNWETVLDYYFLNLT